MSRSKRLEKICKSKRVIAIPSKKVTKHAVDENGNILRDKNGEPITKQTQLYNIYRMY